MTTSPLRLAVERFASMTNANSCEPCVFGAALKNTQDGRSVTDQAHSRAVCIVNVPCPPAAPNDESLTPTATSHLPSTGVGERTDVEDDPQPVSANAMKTKLRVRSRAYA
jgi:hypothetical protein